MSIDLSPEVAAKAKAIPDFEQRLAQFHERRAVLRPCKAEA